MSTDIQTPPQIMTAIAEAVRGRRMVTLRVVKDLLPIEGADAIEIALIDGWKVVVKKGEFKIGDPCLYFEIDSFLQDGVPAWQFLVDKSARTFNGVKGHKLRTIKLKGQISQGLVLAPSTLGIDENVDPATDFDALLGVVKYDPPLPAQLVGQAQGLFPSFIKKTDQERCQNLGDDIFGYEDRLVPFDIGKIPVEALDAMIAKGDLRDVDGVFYKVLRAKASPDDVYEITMKLDGSSMTAFVVNTLDENGVVNGARVGVCSRNLELKVNDENSENAFVKKLIESGLNVALLQFHAESGRQIAVQGELMGPNIQGNREELKTTEFFVFDVYDIDRGFQIPPFLRLDVFDRLVQLGAKIKHVPIIESCVKLPELGIKSVDDLLKRAEGPSLKHAFREGDVYKRMDGQFSFKAISNLFLAKEKD